MTERGLAHEWFAGCEYVNPDFIARDEFGDWNSPEAVIRAANLAQERRERCLAERRSLAFKVFFSVLTRWLLCGGHKQPVFLRAYFLWQRLTPPSMHHASPTG